MTFYQYSSTQISDDKVKVFIHIDAGHIAAGICSVRHFVLDGGDVAFSYCYTPLFVLVD